MQYADTPNKHMKKSTKVMVSAAGALIAGLCKSIPLTSFTGCDPALVPRSKNHCAFAG